MTTRTERLLYWDEGSSDPFDPYRLEGFLIDPEQWRSLWPQMPMECQQAVLDNEPCTGIGKDATVGWFILAGGQGTVLVWSEVKAEALR